MSACVKTILITAGRPAKVSTIIIRRGPAGVSPPGGADLPAWLAALTSLAVTGEELVIEVDGDTYKLPLNKQ